MVLAHVRNTLREYQALSERIEECKAALRGRIAIAATAGLAGSLLASLVHDFRQRYRGIAANVVDLLIAVIVATLESGDGDGDLGLGYDLAASPSLHRLAARWCLRWPALGAAQ